jgi:hypothetical protein
LLHRIKNLRLKSAFPKLAACTRLLVTYRIALILDLWRSRRDLVRIATKVVAQVTLVVNGINSLAETSRLLSLLVDLSTNWANVQTVAQEKLLIK